MPQLTTLTFYRYPTLKRKIWAFQMMQFAHKPMSQVGGLSFYRLLGSSIGLGFNPLPDWSVYAILQVWDDEAAAEEYFSSALHQRYKSQASDIWTVYMQNAQCRGTWSGQTPFSSEAEVQPDDRLAVITRATIKPSELYRFWKYVPQSQTGLSDNPGLRFTKGIGEVPLLQMATFSMWQNVDALKAFAYGQKGHSKAIELTHKRNWYSEELFARFVIVKTTGHWEGIEGL